jgi:glycosyltransferase involved in cell wall biosynthesis
MRWLIVEDSLQGRGGHWFEYLGDFCRELPRLGDEVTLLVSRRAEPFIREQLGGRPVLPESAFVKMSDGAPAWRRYARIPIHAWQTFWAVRRYLRSAPEPEVIFVPTVIVHHLLAWAALVKLGLKRGNARVLLFFPGLPIRRGIHAAVLDGSPTSKLQAKLLRWLEPEIRAGKVILGVETHAMKQAAEQAFGLPFTYFPHPVHATKIESRKQKAEIGEAEQKCGKQKEEIAKSETYQVSGQWSVVSGPSSDLRSPSSELRTSNSELLTMACYGPARHEKGSEVLAAAMEQHLARFPNSRVRFVLQWLKDFSTTSGGTARLPAILRQHPRVEIVDHYFADGEYAQRLASTQALLLPYRRSSYALRVSRVVIEAMVHGLPVVATRGTTLAEQAEAFGAAVLCEDENVESLVAAIETLEQNYEALAATASERQAKAREHFSVRQFREALMSKAEMGKAGFKFPVSSLCFEME